MSTGRVVQDTKRNQVVFFGNQYDRACVSCSDRNVNGVADIHRPR